MCAGNMALKLSSCAFLHLHGSRQTLYIAMALLLAKGSVCELGLPFLEAFGEPTPFFFDPRLHGGAPQAKDGIFPTCTSIPDLSICARDYLPPDSVPADKIFMPDDEFILGQCAGKCALVDPKNPFAPVPCTIKKKGKKQKQPCCLKGHTCTKNPMTGKKFCKPPKGVRRAVLPHRDHA
jgi:hypothetical protein